MINSRHLQIAMQVLSVPANCSFKHTALQMLTDVLGQVVVLKLAEELLSGDAQLVIQNPGIYQPREETMSMAAEKPITAEDTEIMREDLKMMVFKIAQHLNKDNDEIKALNKFVKTDVHEFLSNYDFNRGEGTTLIIACLLLQQCMGNYTEN